MSVCLCRSPSSPRYSRGSVAAMRLGGVVVALVVLVTTAGVKGQDGGQSLKCQANKQCRDCVQTPGCAWCITPKVTGENCQSVAQVNSTSFCNPNDLQDPVNEVTVVEDQELTGAKSRAQAVDDQSQIIQLKPQKVKLRLRKGVAQTLNIQFRRARDYPVDLYYLMDLSKSMEDDKATLASVSTVLADAMTNLTTQFTLGFGSFVDKVMMPYTDTTDSLLMSPCWNCAKPYSFRNDMKLDRNHKLFTDRVNQAKISGNLDFPEGGFDALMQAMVCTKEIGWRDVARRILVFSTDAKFHHAGDGRLAGVVVPNDEQCHLDENDEYTDFDKYDYPSIGQINKVAKERNINVIFAVLSNPKLYQELSNHIETSSFGLLEKSSSNVVELIKEQYQSISSEVSLSDNSSDAVSIVYRSSCKEGESLQETNKCGNIMENDEVTFQLEISVSKCPPNEKGSIVEVKTLEDRVILDIEFLCSCDCPEESDPSRCHNQGTVVCGVCDCHEGFYGEECQCSNADSSGYSEDQNNKCLANEDDTKACSGRGFCRCGVCVCRDPDVVKGTYCECDTRKCRTSDGMCSGHGNCDCDKCKCHSGYTGDYCECNANACKRPGSNQECSGRGTCDCETCRCEQKDNVTYTGQYCEDCLRCGTGKCNQFKDCVQCVHFGNGPRQHDCNTCLKSKLVDSLDEQTYKGARLCTFEDEEGCYVNFTYRYIDSLSVDEVFVQSERKCPEAAPILSIVFSLIGAIVAIGLITLIIWKILTTIHDHREYAKFEKESKNAQFDSGENPLYRSAETRVQNPVFDAQEAH